jgi:hypothetical protein
VTDGADVDPGLGHLDQPRRVVSKSAVLAPSRRSIGTNLLVDRESDVREAGSRFDADVTVTERPSTVMFVVVVCYPAGRHCRADSIMQRVPGPCVRATVFTDQLSARAGRPQHEGESCGRDVTPA